MLPRYLLFLCLTVSAAVSAQPDLNLSFESSGKNGSGVAGWSVGGGDYASARDTSEYTSGSASLRFTAKTGRSDSAFAFLSTELPLQLAVGRTLELRADIKAETIEGGYAGLWVRADKGSAVAAFINSAGAFQEGQQSAPPTGTTDWTSVAVRIDVPPDATDVAIGGLHVGTGSAWFDNVAVYLDGEPYLSTAERPREPLTSPLGPQRPEVEWLRQYVHPLASVDPGYEDSSDLEAFGRAVGTSDLVGLGESSHGSREIFQLKDRLFRYLNRERGFGTFALEASMVPCFEANEYVREGVGSPRAILDGLGFWTWRTEELIELLEGMHAAARDRPVRFTGFDMQDYRPAYAELEAALADDPNWDSRLLQLRSTLDIVRFEKHTDYRTVISERHRGIFDRIFGELRPAVDSLATTQHERQWLQQMVTLLEQFTTPGDHAVRDRAMADNVSWIHDYFPGSKLVLWAHNEHVTTRTAAMGHHLRQTHGPDYLSVGFTFYSGSYTASGPETLGPYPAEQAYPRTLEYLLAAIEEPLFFLDLRALRRDTSPYASWLHQPQGFRQVGTIKPTLEFGLVDVLADYDILIFVRESTPTAFFR
ncbi:erythromycin esterase family protein [Neolewinella sp.]|uniref:erythromycin esterase family protein n=1 Tax=Neolewinella sp. TaxID=2993543 RepID=UPI003B520F06